MAEINNNKCCVMSSRGFRKWVITPVSAAAVGLIAYGIMAAEGKKIPDQVSNGKWSIHDMTRPKPPVITPGNFSTPEAAAMPPSDAIIVFDGKDFSHLTTGGKEPTWKLEKGYMEVTPGKGEVQTKEAFGDAQIHVEWAAPNPPKGNSQGRGNSGLYIMGKYEVQVLDTFENDTYADGGATAIYGQHPPFVNACRKPGEWQVYDIIFRGPRWDDAGKLTRPTTITVFHNGVVTQDHFQLVGPTGHYAQAPYQKHPEKLPINLQNHGDPVRYRSIWVRPLPDVGERGQKLNEGPAIEPKATEPKAPTK